MASIVVVVGGGVVKVKVVGRGTVMWAEGFPATSRFRR